MLAHALAAAAYVDDEEGCLVVPNRLPTDTPPFTKADLQVCSDCVVNGPPSSHRTGCDPGALF